MLVKTKILMGTFATLMLQERDRASFKPIYQLLYTLDNSLSSYKPTAPIYRLNHDRKASINRYTYQALLLAKRYYKESDGYFNIAIGGITRGLFHFGENETIPLTSQLQQENISLSKLYFNETSASLKDDIKIDLGGFGKGFAVDVVAKYMREHNLSNARVALSGDIRCMGICKIEVNNPDAKNALASFFTKEKDMGITTSGIYNRFVKTVEHNHLINPKTKESEKNFISITLISKLPSSDLDAYATAVSVMPKKMTYKFLEQFNLAYIILDAQKKLHISSNINEYVTNLFLCDTPKK